MNRIRAITGDNFDPAAIQLNTLCQVAEIQELAAIAFELQSNMVIKFKPKEVAFEKSVIDEKDAWRLVSSNRDGGGVFYFNDVTKKKLYHWNLPYPPPHPVYCLPARTSQQQQKEVELFGIRVASHCHCQKQTSGCKRCHDQKIPCCRGGVKHQYKPTVQLVRLTKTEEFTPRTMEIFRDGRRRIYEYVERGRSGETPKPH